MSLCSYKLRPIPRAIPLVLIVCGTIYHDPITTNRDYSTKDMRLVRRMIAIEDQQDFQRERGDNYFENSSISAIRSWRRIFSSDSDNSLSTRM